MKTIWTCQKALLFVIIIFLAGSTLSAQDLGTSNKLFGKKKPAASKAKKTAGHAKGAAPNAKRKARSKQKASSVAKTPVRIAPRTSEKPTIDPHLHMLSVPNRSTSEAYNKLIAEGDAARDERRFAAAESAYMKAESVSPKDPRAPIGLGSLYINMLRWEDAEKAYRTAIRLDPTNPIAFVALSYVLTQPVASPDLSDRYDEAEKAAKKAVELQSNKALAYDQLGVAMERRGLIGPETEAAYRRAIMIEPEFAPAYAHLGRLMLRHGRTAEAATAYSQALARANDVPAMTLVAETMQSEQRFGDSIPLLKRAIERDPRNPSALVMLGRALTATGKFDEAESFLTRSTAVNPTGFVGYSVLGGLYLRQGKFEMAENSLMQAARFAAPFERLQLAGQFEAVGDAYSKIGRSEAAERAYRKALALDDGRRAVAGKIAGLRR